MYRHALAVAAAFAVSLSVFAQTPREQLDDADDARDAVLADVLDRLDVLEDETPPPVVDPPAIEPSVAFAGDYLDDYATAVPWDGGPVGFAAEGVLQLETRIIIGSDGDADTVRGLDQPRAFTAQRLQDAADEAHARGTTIIRLRVTGWAGSDPPEDVEASVSEAIFVGVPKAEEPSPLPPDPADPPVIEPGVGFSEYPLPAGARVIYVSSAGSDGNDGLSPETPVRTPRKGSSLVRDRVGDQVRFRAGDTIPGTVGDFGKSGASPTAPIVFGVYGDGDRPQLIADKDRWFSNSFNSDVQYIVFQGLHLKAGPRDPSTPGFNADMTQWPDAHAKMSAIGFLGDDSDIRVEDCRVEWFKFGLVFQSNADHGFMENVAVHRTQIFGSYGHWDSNIAGHSSGAYCEHVDGLSVTDSVLDRNGWHPSINGAKKTKFNHNWYTQSDCKNVRFLGNIVARGSSHGVQLRPGGEVSDNLFVENPLAFYVGREASIVRYNVVLKSPDLDPDKPGVDGGSGIGVNPTIDAEVYRNIVSQKEGSFEHGAAIHIDWTSNGMRWLDDRPFRVSVYDNFVYRWPYVMSKPEEAITPELTEPLSMKINQAATLVRFSGNVANDPAWPDPGRDVAGYAVQLQAGESLEDFLEIVKTRPRGAWNTDYTAPGFNAWFRAGFGISSERD